MTMASPVLRIGIVGSGRIARAHAGILRQVPQARVQAVCDVDAPRARALADHVGARAYGSHRDLLAHEDVDAVLVCTPTRTHAEIALDVLSAGKHLFVEKPLAFGEEEAQQVHEAAAKAGRIAAVGHQWRYLRGVERVREIVGNQPISLFAGTYYWTWPLVGWIADKEQGGGQVMDQAIHLVDLARYVGGEVARVYARYTLQARKEQGFPNWDASGAVLSFRSGAVMTLTCTYALFPGLKEPPRLDVVVRDRLLRITPHALHDYLPGEEHVYAEPEDSALAQDRAFVEACLRQDPSLVRCTVSDALHTLRVVLAANRSAASGEPVDLPPP